MILDDLPQGRAGSQVALVDAENHVVPLELRQSLLHESLPVGEASRRYLEVRDPGQREPARVLALDAQLGPVAQRVAPLTGNRAPHALLEALPLPPVEPARQRAAVIEITEIRHRRYEHPLVHVPELGRAPGRAPRYPRALERRIDVLDLDLDELVQLPGDDFQYVDAHPFERILGARHGRAADDHKHDDGRDHASNGKAFHRFPPGSEYHTCRGDGARPLRLENDAPPVDSVADIAASPSR